MLGITEELAYTICIVVLIIVIGVCYIFNTIMENNMKTKRIENGYVEQYDSNINKTIWIKEEK